MTSDLAMGRVDDASTTRWLRHVRGYVASMEKHGTENLRSFHKKILRGEPYHYYLMNGLGYLYAARLARAYVEPLFLVAERGGADGLAEAAAPAVDVMRDIIFDALIMMKRRDPTMVREAFAELAPVLPVPNLDIEWEIDQALASYQGEAVYFKDFQLNIWSVLGTTAELVETFLLFHAVPEEVLIHPVEGQPYFVPVETFRAGGRGSPARLAVLRDVLKAANDQVRRQTYYGVRQERVPDHPFFTVLMWSNGSASWFINWGSTTAWPRLCALRNQCEFQLDANEIVVPYPPIAVHEVIEAVDLHPLYQFSSEAKERGEYPEATDAGVRRAIRSAIDQAMPGMDPEERAVLAIDWFSHFKAAKAKVPGQMEKVEAFLREFPVWPGFARLLEEWFKVPRHGPW